MGRLAALLLLVMLAAPPVSPARFFDGVDDKVDGGTANGDLDGLTALTVSAWVNTATISGARSIFRSGDSSSSPYIDFGAYLCSSGGGCSAGSSKLTMAVSTTTISPCSTTSTVATNTWIHFAGSWDGSNIRSYFNGGLENTCAKSGTLADVNDAVRIGYNASFGEYWSGKLANVCAWNAKLSDAEIAALAKGAPCPSIRPGNLKRNFPLWGAASPEPDLAGSGKNGTVTGAIAADHCPCGPGPK